MNPKKAIAAVERYRDSIVSHPGTRDAMTTVVDLARDSWVYRASMVAWAEELEAAGSPMGPLIALEVRARIAAADEAKRREE